jgi:hypothetical protein
MRDPAGPVEARTIETARIERLLILDRLALFAPMTVHIEAVQIETLQYQLNLLRNGLEPGRRLVYFGTEAEIRSEISAYQTPSQEDWLGPRGLGWSDKIH